MPRSSCGDISEILTNSESVALAGVAEEIQGSVRIVATLALNGGLDCLGAADGRKIIGVARVTRNAWSVIIGVNGSY